MWLCLNAEITRGHPKGHLEDPEGHQWSSDHTWGTADLRLFIRPNGKLAPALTLPYDPMLVSLSLP